MRSRLLFEQEIASEMFSALHEGQFEMWLQPQYNHATGVPIGAEALVRWHRPKSARLVYPGQFIEIFERNGFIYELDKYVWEQACALLRRLLNKRCAPPPISVNVSRKDLLRADFLEVLTSLTKRYAIPLNLLHLEITESAFVQSSNRLIDAIRGLVARGFTVEIDDFGSGYSSLNMLKDIPAHTVKLDMRFLARDESSQRGNDILESVVGMVRRLGMTALAEGVETKAQADYLRSIGCPFVQGRLYARPMQMEAYEELMTSAQRGGRARPDEPGSPLPMIERQLQESRGEEPAALVGQGKGPGYPVSSVELTRLRESEKSLRVLADDFSDGLGIFEHDAGSLRILYVNQGFCHLLGCRREELPALWDTDPLAVVDSEDRPLVRASLLPPLRRRQRHGAVLV
jgi:EAL domain-containing protein (putative c-di-GMP-specific phosphodiesterase class I)